MMSKYFKTIVFIALTTLCCNKINCQKIGFLLGTDISKDKKVNGSLGGGLYVNWPVFKKKFDLQFSSFLAINNQKLIESDRDFFIYGIVSSYLRIGGAASTLYIIPISNTMEFKTGPCISYNYINLSVLTIGDSSIRGERLHSISSGFRNNFNFKLKEKSKLSFDVFFDSTFLFKLQDSGSFPERAKLNNTVLYTFSIGATYPL